MKKRISLAIAVIMIMTHLLSIVSFADFSDVTEDNNYRPAIITLTKLGVINGYEESDKTFTFRPEGKITRAEFTKMLVTALGRGNHTTEPTEFSDVAGHWARFNIKTAYDMGIINGFDDGTFRPDEQVTYEQALKMMVCTLGYIDFAEGKGGWPTGYTTQANELGLTKGITNQKNSEPALRQVIAQVVYNALEVHKMEKNLKGEYELTDHTILKDDLQVSKVKGVVVGVEDVRSDDCSTELLDYQMAVEDDSNTEYVIDVRDYKELTVALLQQYVGKLATVYYSQDRIDGKKLVVFDSDTVKNVTYTISYKDIVSFDGSSLKYYEKDAIRTSSLKINPQDMTVIYNGQTLKSDETYTLLNKDDSTDTTTKTGKADTIAEILNPTSNYFIYGDVTFTDSGSDGSIDMATINDYRWMVAYKTVNSTDYKVQNSLVTTDSLILDPDSVNEKVYVEKNGKEVEPTAISSGDILTYTKSFDGTIKRVYVSKKTVTGEVNSLSADKITIAGTEYNLDKNCVQYMKNKGNTVNVGSNVTMYLDKMGTVVYGTVKQDAAIPYGYIADVVYDGGEDATYVKAFYPTLSSTKLSNMKLSASAKIDGKKIANANEALSLLDVSAATNENNGDKESGTGYTGTAPTNTTYSQVARIKYDKSTKEITEIITLTNQNVGNTNIDKSVIVKSRDFAKYNYNSTTFKPDGGGAQFSVNSSTVIIDVPADRHSSDYMKKTYSNFTSKTGSCWAEAYDVNASRVASLVIRYNIGTETRITKKTKTSAHSVVAGPIGQNVDDNETLVSTIPLYSASESSKDRIIADGAPNLTAFQGLEIGDVVQFDTDEESKIQGLEYVFKYSDIKSILDRGSAVINGETPGAGETLYDWTGTLTQDSTNRWQKYKFDFKFPRESVSSATENYYDTYTSNGADNAYSRAVMYNVVRILDGNKVQVTKEGFDENMTMDIEAVDVEEISISSSTNMLKLAANGRFVTVNDEGGDLDITSLKDAEHYGMNCSKIMVSTITGSVKLVVIYQ